MPSIHQQQRSKEVACQDGGVLLEVVGDPPGRVEEEGEVEGRVVGDDDGYDVGQGGGEC